MLTGLNSDSEYLPVVNGVVYSDGRVERYTISVDENRRRTLSNGGISCDIFESVAYVNDELTCEDMGIKFACGEGSYGGDGFVLAERSNTSELIWLMSFDDSNPFVKLERKEGSLFAENNCGEVWHINIADINKINISIIKQNRYL